MTTAFAVYYLFKSVTGFACICLESLLLTQRAYIIYWYAVAAFGIFAWLLFLCCFKLKASHLDKTDDDNKEEEANDGYVKQ